MTRPNRRFFLQGTALAGLTLGLGLPAAVRAQQTNKPNIIFLMADDMGYADLSCYGAQGYETPVLDKLAADGIRFTQAYANAPICSPTRVALVTGRYQGRYRAGLAEPNIRFAPGDELPLETPTVATLMRGAGYRTALVGKWHVSKVPDFNPTRYGYDSYFGISSGAADYFNHSTRPAKGPGAAGTGLYQNDQPVERKGYLTDIIADEAIRLIGETSTKPLYLAVHFTAPHWPWEGPEDEAVSQNLTKMSDPTGGSLQTYAKQMISMDQNIGRILAAIETAGQSENTIVVFTSDNGGERYSNTWPLVGYKGELMEGGIRTPLIVRWPAQIKPGSQTEQVAISMDTVPTFLAAAGAAIPKDMEGINLLPQLTGAAKPVERTLFWRMNRNTQGAVRQGDWKYLRIAGQEHLYNITDDPRERAEKRDLHPETLAELRAKFDAWNAEMLPYPAKSPSENAADIYVDRYAAGAKGGSAD